MRIAILTQPLRTNYGGILQNYALQTILKRRGHSVVTLERDRIIRVRYPRYAFTLCKRLLLKVLGKYKGTLFQEKKYNKDYPIFTQHTLRFVRDNISKKEVKDFRNIKRDDYDAYIVGSDQVWRPAYNNIANTFLDFTSEWDVKRIAYAASFGTDQWEFSNEQTEICRSLIARFQAVSVRESSGISLCQEYLQRDALHVLDPTMLLKRTDYESLISDAYVTPIKGQIFVHILDKDEDKTILIGKIEKLKNWESFSINCAVDEHEVYVPIEFRIQPPVEQWLLGFRKAEFVVTDSFHATVFSIIFNKPFIVYANEKRGLARFVSLLEMFGLEHRIITNSNQFTEALLAPIDFNYANQRMESLRETSLNFLYNHL